MNRRQLIKSGALTYSGLWLSVSPFNKLFAAGNTAKPESSTIKEIHIVNLSHHDYGYTDLPSSVWDFQKDNIRRALKYIKETENYPAEARFRWTEEGLWGVEKFWQDASEQEKNVFKKYAAEGRLEVTAMPGNMTCLVDKYEWEKELDRLAPFYKMFKPKVALQDDVNGLPWGMVDSLLDRNIKYITMSANGYMGGPPLPRPSFFWWQGASGKKILMFNGEGYADGYEYFHDKEWRRGPVPNRYDIWFNGPSGNEIFSTKKEDLQKSKTILDKRLEKLVKQGYTLPVLPIAFTNMWTIDNDWPCRQLSEFIKAWNEEGLQPKLVFSTPSIFIEKIISKSPQDIPTLKGEWCDWWAEGIAASPFEVAILQAAKRRNRDIGNALNYFSVSNNAITKMIEELNYNLVFAAEHTWGAYDSVAHPYNERTLGNHAQKFDYFFKADEDSKRIQAEIIRNSKVYKPLSQSNHIEVMNPGKAARSGWVEVSAVALRIKANGVQESGTNRVLPFEQTLASEWSPVDGASETPPEIPNDVWPFRPGKYKFHVENLQPGEKKKFELVNAESFSLKPVTASRFYKPVIDEKTGMIKNIIYTPLNIPVFDETSAHLPAQIVVERPQGKYIRDAINARNVSEKDFKYTQPAIKEKANSQNVYALRYTSVQEEDFAKRIEQQWDIFDAIPRIEITTTIWMKENLDPIAVYMAFPFAVQSPRAFYDSLGAFVEVGVDQMPNTCGLYNTVQNGVNYKGSNISLALTTLDAPMGIFESIVRTTKRTVFKPETGHFFSLLCDNYWTTNFAVLQPSKLVFRHIIECGTAGENIVPLENNEMWGYPSV